MPIDQEENAELTEAMARARAMYEIYLGTEEGDKKLDERDLSNVKRFVMEESPGSLEDFEIC